MPPRLNKRQQRELEELEALGAAPSAQDLNDDQFRHATIGNGGVFSNFLEPEEIDQEESEDEITKPTKSQKKRKKKKKPIVPASDATAAPGHSKVTPQHITPATGPSRTHEKKAEKKAKAKEKKTKTDDLEQALAELSLQYPELRKVHDTGPKAQALSSLLAVSLAHLDREAEMRKFFGAKVVQSNKTEPSRLPGSSRRLGGSQRSNLTRPQPSWWAAKQREGLSIRTLSEDEMGQKLDRNSWKPLDEKWWTVDYSKKYKSMTKSFIQTVMTGDPQGFWDLLGKHPWHADTLLQMSEVYLHREEYGQAVDFVDRALFTYERSFIGAFNFKNGSDRLDFDRVENRPFFLAVHRQVTNLQRKGCARTAFEFSRLLYSLDPWSDPHGALFHLDLLALKAGMSQWLLDVYDTFIARKKQYSKDQYSRMDPSLLPGWTYARALALKIQEDAKKEKSHEASTAALKEALFSFPSIVPLLADKLDIYIPLSVRAHPDFKIRTDSSSLSPPNAILHLLSHLYVQRSFSMWKEESHSSWFSSTVTTTFSTLPSVLPATDGCKRFLSLYENPTLQYSAYRHIMVLESSYRRLFSFIPRQILDAKALACDPLPPPTSKTEYDQNFFEGIDDVLSMPRSQTRQQRAAEERRLAQMIPDAAYRQQLQAFFQAHPDFAERFPGGILQFMQVIGQLPEGVLEEMLLMEAIGDDGGARDMPGQMPGFEELMQEELEEPFPAGILAREDQQGTEAPNSDMGEESSEEEDNDIPIMPRVLRNLIGRFWGRAPVAEDSSGDEALADDTGVD